MILIELFWIKNPMLLMKIGIIPEHTCYLNKYYHFIPKSSLNKLPIANTCKFYKLSRRCKTYYCYIVGIHMSLIRGHELIKNKV